MANPVDAGTYDDLPEATPVVRQVAKRDLVLVRWRGDVYALRNICPHMSTQFAKGSVMGHRTGRVGEVEVDAANPIMTCPWHQYEYRLEDGQCITDAGLRVRSYPVTLVEGRILVDLDGHRGRGEAGAPAPTEQAAVSV